MSSRCVFPHICLGRSAAPLTVDRAEESTKIVSTRLLNWMTTMDRAGKGLATDNLATVSGVALVEEVVAARIRSFDAQPELT